MNKVLKGKNNRLFLDNDSNDINAQHRGDYLLNTEKKDIWKKTISGRKEFFEDKNISYLHMVSPDSHSVCYNDLPYELSDYRPIDQYFELLDEIEFNDCLHPRDRLIEVSQSGGNVYPKSDTHWSSYGGYLASIEILKMIESISTFEFDFTLLERFEKSDLKTKGDLGSKVNPAFYSETSKVTNKDESSKLIFSNEIDVTAKLRIFENRQSSGPVILIFGTSFSYDVIPVLKEFFSKLIFFHSTSIDFELIEKISPDIVLTELPERFLVSPPVDSFEFLRLDTYRSKLKKMDFENLKKISKRIAGFSNNSDEVALFKKMYTREIEKEMNNEMTADIVDDSDVKPLFVIGAPRSGTTLLAQLVNCLPYVHITDELRVVSWFSTEIDKMKKGYKVHGNPYPFNFGPEYAEYLSNNMSSFLRPFFSKMALESGKENIKWWGDKYPHYDEELEQISKSFPRAHFIFIYRDIGDVVLSVIKGHEWGFDKSLKYVSGIVDSYLSKLIKHDLVDRTHFLKYSDMVSDLDTQVYNMAHFLNVEINEDVLLAARQVSGTQSHSVRVDKNSPVAFNAKNAVGKWRSTLEVNQVNRVEEEVAILKEKYSSFNIW